MSFSFYDPSIAVRKAVPMAKRPERLSGKTVGLYDNTKEKADVILEVLGEELGKYGVKTLMTQRGVHYSRPAPADLVEEMARKCDVVVCALGG